MTRLRSICKSINQLAIIWLVVNCFDKCSCVKLDEDGYYDITIAISEKTAQSDNVNYMSNLKSDIQDLSDAIFESTKRKFSIRSANIVVPNHWEDVDADGLATTEAFHTADIRISHEFLAPQTINPTFCGYPGKYIELPYSFFDTVETGPYGPTGKALLTLWARYRFGVHEENGYPADPQFPYFWKKTRLPDEPEDAPDTWELSHCANKELQGEFRNSKGELCSENESDDPNDIYPPASDCKFVFSTTQTATSSLMSFPFITSLKAFCDEEDHNKRAPNRQNLYCQFKSVWEVIRQSRDWQLRNEASVNVRTPIKYKIVKKTTKPLLYILADGGDTNKPNDAVITAISLGLDQIFNKTENWNVLTGAGVFPSLDKRDSYDTTYPWSYPWYNPKELVAAFEGGFETRTGIIRNYPAAIQDIGNYIRDLYHEPGAIIIVIKYGFEQDTFGRYPPFEPDVLATILSQNIRVFALEGQDFNALEGNPLQQIGEMSGGIFYQLSGDDDADAAGVADVMTEVDKLLTDGHVPQGRYRLAYKTTKVFEATDGPSSTTIPILYENVEKYYFYVIQLGQEFINGVKFVKGPGGVNLPTFQEVISWGVKSFDTPIFAAEIPDGFDKISEWETSMYCSGYECFTMVIVIVELKDENSPNPGNNFHLSVLSSVEEDHYADMNVESSVSLKGTAFSIYAKIEKNGHAVNSPNLEVQANIIYYADDRFTPIVSRTVNLTDNGKGVPDVTKHDGIFSGSIVPPTSPDGDLGVFQVFVTAVLRPGPGNTRNISILESYEAPFRCGSGYSGCWSETIDAPIVLHAELKRRIQFHDSIRYNGQAAVTRIMDFAISPHPTVPDEYNLTWTEPMIVDAEATGRLAAKEYEIYYTDDFNKLFGTISDLDRIPSLPIPSIPGRIKYTMVGIPPGTKRYYIMRSISRQEDAPTPVLSNVVFIHAANPYVVPTTLPSTPFEPPTTPPTTRRTGPTRASTLPTRETTAASTTPTTTTTRRSTTRTTPITTTTTERRSTFVYETTTVVNKLWYEKKGAIITFSVFGVGTVGLIVGVVVYRFILSKS